MYTGTYRAKKKPKHLVSKYSRKIRNTTQKDHDDDN